MVERSTERVDIADLLKKGVGKRGDGATHAANTEFSAEEIERFTPKSSGEQIEEIAKAPVSDKYLK